MEVCSNKKQLGKPDSEVANEVQWTKNKKNFYAVEVQTGLWAG